MATETRTRRSIRKLSESEQDNLIRAFIGIQKLPPDHENSFFKIAGYHGEPFVKQSGKDYEWGGYCSHSSVLFPTWHRAYCLRIEDALRSIEGCENVTLPYWDEFADTGLNKPVPDIFTQPRYTFFDNSGTVDNPLFTYELPEALKDTHNKGERYTKHVGYKTVRFPFSGLVGTPDDKEVSDRWNLQWDNPAKDLNYNIRNWFRGDVKLEEIKKVINTDTFSIYERMRSCLDAPNWTAFSNRASARQWALYNKRDEKSHYVVSLEEPHNAIHLGLGGFFQPGGPDDDGYNANEGKYQNANGDMGDNETAAFDPIFFFHHCFIDYMMWAWQKRHNKTERGSLVIEYDWTNGKGVYMEKGNAGIGPHTPLRMTTPLAPFTKPDSEEYWTSEDVTNIREIGYQYEDGSFEQTMMTYSNELHLLKSAEVPELIPARDIPLVANTEVAEIKVSEYSGSFVIRTYAVVNGERIQIGYDPILSRYNTSVCGNCQSNETITAIVPLEKKLADQFMTMGVEPEKGLPFSVEIQHRAGTTPLSGGEGWNKAGQVVEGGIDGVIKW